jgi:hypothetical protein
METVGRMAALGKAPGGLSVAAHPGLVTPMGPGFTRLPPRSGYRCWRRTSPGASGGAQLTTAVSG